MDVMALFQSLQEAYEDVQEKAVARDKAAAVLNTTSKELAAAADKLKALQDTVNGILGQATDPRIRQSA